MARAATTTRPALPAVQHEHFCLPRDEYDAPRVEQYPAVGDDGEGRERTLIVTRCIECGAARYDNPS